MNFINPKNFHTKYIFLTTFVLSLGYSMVLPLIPYLLKNHVSQLEITILLSVYPITKGLGSLFSTRKQWIAIWIFLLMGGIAYFAMFLGKFMFLFLIIGRMIEGGVLGYFLAYSQHKLRLTTNQAGGVLSTLNTFSLAGLFLGPFIINIWDIIHEPFYAYLCIGVLAIFTCVMGYKGNQTTQVKNNPIVEPHDKANYQTYVVILSFMLFDLTYGFLAFLIPLYFSTKLTTNLAGWGITGVFSIGFIIFMGCMPLFGKLSDKKTSRAYFLWPFWGIAFVFFILSVYKGNFILWVCILFVEYVFAAWAYAYALKFLSLYGHVHSFAHSGFLQSVGMIIGPYIAYYSWHSWQVKSLFILGGSYIFMGVLILFLFTDTHINNLRT